MLKMRPIIFSSSRLLLLLAVLLAGGAGCGKKAAAPAAADAGAAAVGVRKEYERGPLRVELELSATEISIAERLRLRLTAKIAEGYEVDLPAFGEKLEQFAIVDYSTPPPRLQAGGIVEHAREYTLEPFLSGDYKIPPMTVRFREKPKTPDAAGLGTDQNAAWQHNLETEELTVKVNSLLPADMEKLKPNDMAPPAALPPSPLRRAAWPVAAAVLLLLLAGLAWWLIRRRQRAVAEKRLPAHVVAYGRLEALAAAKLIEQGQVKEFFLRLSAILRHFIEDRFGLRAPERTTEEFLYEIRAGALSEANRKLLQEFLTGCDLVKFAEHQPATQEIQHAFNLCRRFIEENEEPAAEVQQ